MTLQNSFLTQHFVSTIKLTTPSIRPVFDTENKKLPQFPAAFSATIAVFSTGLHTGWPAPSLPKLLSDEYPYEVSSDEGSYITSGIWWVGCWERSFWIKLDVKEPFWRWLYHNWFHSSVGGIGEGMTFTIVLIYIAEIAEPTIRGTLGTLIFVTCMCSILYVNIVGSYLSIKITAVTFSVFPIIFLLLFWKMPESPYYLLMKNRQNEAETSLKFLRRKSNVSEQLTVVVKDVNRQMSESGTYRDIFTIDSNRKAFFLMLGTRIFQQWTGISAFSLYIQLLLKEATEALSPRVGSTILFIQLLVGVVATLFVDKSGRKPLLLISTGGCCVNFLIQALYFGLKEHADVDLAVLDWLPLVMMILFVMLFTSGLGVMVNIVNSEIFSTSIKGKCVCLVNVVFALGMMSTTKYYQATADAYGFWILDYGLGG